MRNTRIVLLICIMALLSACGFTLRGQQIPQSLLSHLTLESTPQYSDLHQTMQQLLEKQGMADSLNGQIQNTMVLQPENIERRLLSVFSTGQVAEYELIYNVRYALSLGDNPPVSYQFVLTREYQDDPRQVLAKTRELNLVLSELRQEAARTIYQRLPANITQQLGL
ncbi:MAG: LPS assembly lipoprotein LptE [Glaciecola sp.]|jgi:LPS-assembly lipoprotein|uniref:LPS-assembly lipoprotein LptE n=1 Tax=Glaciecola sp. HTCC2999 TaxID=455436 RepID=UPI0000E0E994|nr:LPS assembly lipoprotein LptE [Glaciecola sp. HTCC2999]